MEHPDSIRNDVDTMTLPRYIMQTTRDSDFVILLNAIQTSCKLISRSVRKAGIAGLCKFILLLSSICLNIQLVDGQAGSENATGDSQKKIDVLSDEIMVNALYHSHVCAVLVSEERDNAIIIPEPMQGKFIPTL